MMGPNETISMTTTTKAQTVFPPESESGTDSQGTAQSTSAQFTSTSEVIISGDAAAADGADTRLDATKSSSQRLALQRAVTLQTFALPNSSETWLGRLLDALDNKFESPICQLVSSVGLLGHLLLIFGGMKEFRSVWANRLYELLWVSAFVFCAAMCLLNIYWNTSPYHNVTSNILTAYIHVPVFFAWRFWRTTRNDDHFVALVDPIHNTKERHGLLKSALHIHVTVVFVLMLVVSGLVLAAFAVPAMATCVNYGSNMTVDRTDFGPETAHFTHLVLLDGFVLRMTCIHAISMFLFIPPVICVTLMVYGFVWIVFFLHMTDFYALDKHLHEKVTEFQSAMLITAHRQGDLDVKFLERQEISVGLRRGKAIGSLNLRTRSNISATPLTDGETLVLRPREPSSKGDELVPDVVKVSKASSLYKAWLARLYGVDEVVDPAKDALEAKTRNAQLHLQEEPNAEDCPPSVRMLAGAVDDALSFTALVERLRPEMAARQKSLNTTCKLISRYYIHLLLFNTAQVVGVVANMNTHLSGDLYGVPYTWYWALADAFHILVGLVLTMALLFIYMLTGNVTKKLEPRLCALCDELLICAPRQAMLLHPMKSALDGTHIMGVALSTEFCIMFIWGTIITIWSTIVASVQI